MSDPIAQLLRALARSAAAAGCVAQLAHERSTPWATVTFIGARHTMRASGEPAGLTRWLAMLPEADLPLAGRFVASCAAEMSGGAALIELLVLDD